MLRKCVLLVALCWLAATSAAAHAFDLTELQKTLAGNDIIRGDFTQTKTLAMLDKPLVSKGHFVLGEEYGLLWQQTSPFPVTLVLTKDTLTQTMPGQQPQVIRAEDNPMAFYFSNVFLSLFNADTTALAKAFSHTLEGDTKSWTLQLVPNTPPLDKVFSGITLSGDSDITGLQLTEVRGDKTDIAFSNIRHTPDTLSDGERRAFSH